MNKEFTFKSISPYFEKERDGLKPNTVRVVDIEDKRFIKLLGMEEFGYEPGEIKIKIVDAEDPSRFFIRDIKDISVWNSLMIISWVHGDSN